MRKEDLAALTYTCEVAANICTAYEVKAMMSLKLRKRRCGLGQTDEGGPQDGGRMIEAQVRACRGGASCSLVHAEGCGCACTSVSAERECMRPIAETGNAPKIRPAGRRKLNFRLVSVVTRALTSSSFLSSLAKASRPLSRSPRCAALIIPSRTLCHATATSHDDSQIRMSDPLRVEVSHLRHCPFVFDSP